VQTTNQVLGIFSHLQIDGRAKKLATTFSRDEKVQPAVIAMGLKFSQGILDSVNSRTVGMLTALKSFIHDVAIGAHSVFNIELANLITVQIDHLVTSKRHAMAMGNVINWLKSSIATVPAALSHEQARHQLCVSIDYFVEERIHMAASVIADKALLKIKDGDVILTISRHPVIEKMLLRLTQ
jgi:translation initiation factor 2B subunit (eIF-2B alpha/beta/delta family)